VSDPPAPAATPTTPYKGLVPYEEQDAAFFFGREAEREIITANLIASRLTLLYGESGVGKSSILQAGVVHDLRAEARRLSAERGTPEVVVAVFNAWRDDPVAGLIGCVEEAASAALGRRSLDGLERGRSLAESLEAIAEHSGCDLLVILDQFEEYFLYHSRAEGNFEVELPRALGRGDLRANFLVAIREDSLAKLDCFKASIPGLFDNYLRVEHLDIEAARAAIERPVEQYNRLLPKDTPEIKIEPRLVARVLEEVRAGRVNLGEAVGRGTIVADAASKIETPYLQLVMTRLWQEEMAAGSRVLRAETLDRLGGAEQIVRTHLDSAMDALSAPERDAAAAVFHHLVTPSGTKIAHTAFDLADYAELPQTTLVPVLEKLSGSRIRVLRPVAPPVDQPGAPRYQIFHDVLGPAVLDWRRRHLHAQEQAEAAAQAEEERRRIEAQARADERARTAGRLRRLRLALVVVVVMLLAGLAVFSYLALRRARDGQRAAVSRELAMGARQNLERDPDLATLLALEAVAASRSAGEPAPEAQDALNRAVQAVRAERVFIGHPMQVLGVGLSPDGAKLATASLDQTARVWDLESGQELLHLVGHSGGLTRVAWSPSGNRIATSSLDGTVRVWDATDGKELLTLAAAPTTRLGIELAADKASVTAIVDGGLGERAGLERDDLIVALNGVEVADTADLGRMIALSPPGEEVEIGLRRGDRELTVEATLGPLPEIWAIAWSPDGRRLATGDNEGRVALWEAASGRPLATRFAHTANVWGLAYDPAGRRLATAGWDGVVRVWDGELGNEILGFPPALSGWLGITRRPVPADTATSFGLGEGQGVLIGEEPESDMPALEAGIRKGDVLLRVDGEAITPENLRQLVDSRAGEGVEIELVREGGPLTVRLTIKPQPEPVNDVAWSPDGGRLAAVDNRGHLRIWSADSAEPLYDLAGHSDRAYRLAWSPDGRRLATTGRDNTARVWDAAAGKELVTIADHDNTTVGVVWLPDGERLVTASYDGRVRTWSSAGALLGTRVPHPGEVWGVDWSPDGTRLATAGIDQLARVWDPFTGEELLSLHGHGDRVCLAAWSPDGRRLATASRDGSARLWDGETGELQQVLEGHEDTVFDLAWSPDGRRLATASLDKSARLWDAATGEPLAVFEGHTAGVWAVAFHPSGHFVATGSQDHTARVWDVTTGDEVFALHGHERPLLAVAWSPDGDRLATASVDRTVKVWGTPKIAADVPVRVVFELRSHREEVWDVAWSPDGDTIATAGRDGTARLWDAASGREVAVFAGHAGTIFRVAWSPDSHRLASAGLDGTVRIWVNPLAGHRDLVFGLAFSPDGRRLVSAGRDGLAAVWDASNGLTGEPLLLFADHDDELRDVAWSPDGGRIATVGLDRARRGQPTLRVRDPETGDTAVTIDLPTTPNCVAWHPDGEQLAACGVDGVQIRDGESGIERLRLTGHRGVVWAAAWNPDGTRLVTAADDKAAIVWDAATGKVLRTLIGHSEAVYGVAWSPDGRCLVTASRDGSVKLWDADSDGPPTLLRGHTGAVVDVRFDSRGRVATASLDGSVRVWDVESERELASFDVHPEGAWNVVWSPDGRYLATTGGDGRIRAYGLALDDLEAQARVLLLRPLTTEECREYLHADRCPPTAIALARLVDARRLAGRGEIEAAEARLDEARVLDPGILLDPEPTVRRWAGEARLIVGRHRLRVGDVEQAEASLEAAQELDPTLNVDLDAERRAAFTRVIARAGSEIEREHWKMAFASLERAMALEPDSGRSLAVLALAGALYHDYMFDYQAAYDRYQKVVERTPNDPSALANFAEANLATGRFQDAYGLAERVLATEGVGDDSQLTMRFLKIASLLMQGKTEPARREIGEFIRAYRKLEADFESGWSYYGTTNFVRNRSMGADSRRLILRLIDVLEGDLGIDEFEAGLRR